MKLLAKDLSTGVTNALTKIDVDDSTGDMTTLGVVNGIGMELPSQGTRPTNLSKGVWVNTSNELRFYDGASDYEVAHSGTALAGDVTGTLGATVVGDDTHNHSNTTLTGVPGNGIDTSAIHSGDSTGGDLSGTYPTNLTVVKIQGNDVLSGTPSDGQVLTWVNANTRWEATDPSGGATYYQIADSSMTHTAIQAMLDDADTYVVYLKPGNYTSVTAGLSVPDGKSLIGLENEYEANNQVNLNSMGTTGYITMGRDSYLKNVTITITGGTFTSGYAVYSNLDPCVAENVRIYCAAGNDAWGFSGKFRDINRCIVYGMRGITAENASPSAGFLTIRNCSLDGANFVDGGGYGIRLGTSADYAKISNVYINDYCRGALSMSECSDVQIDNLYVDTCAFHATTYSAIELTNSIRCQFNNVMIYQSSTSAGDGVSFDVNAGCDYLTVRGLTIINSGYIAISHYNGTSNSSHNCVYEGVRIYNTDNVGVSISGGTYALKGMVLSDIHVYSAGTRGFQLGNLDGLSASNLAAEGCGYRGIQASTLVNSQLTGLNTHNNTDDGINLTADNTSVTGVNTTGNTGQGFEWVTGADYALLSAVNAEGNGGTGVLTGNASSATCKVTGVNSHNNTTADENIGTNWTVDVTPSYNLVGDVSGPLTATVVANDSHNHTATTITLASTGLTDQSSLLRNTSSIKDLGDVYSSMSPGVDQVLEWDNVNSRWDAASIPAIPTTIASLNDTDITSPAEGQILAWDGSNSWDNIYPGMVNESGNRTYVILAAGTSTADINTALTNYDVVYLEPGTYTYTGTSTYYTVPAGKSLIGIGVDEKSAGTNRVLINITGAPTGNYVMKVNNGHVENIKFQVGGGGPSLAGKYIIEGDSTNSFNSVRNCYFINSVTANTGVALYGRFESISKICVTGWDGINLTGTVSAYGGRHIIEDFYIQNSPTYGIYLSGTSIDDYTIRDGFITSTAASYGIRSVGGNDRLSISDLQIDNVDIGIYHNDATNYSYDWIVKNVRIDSVDNDGIYADHASTWSFDSIHIEDPADRGIDWATTTASCSFNNIYVYSSGSWGISIIGGNQHSVTNCKFYDCVGGLSIYGNYQNVSNLTAYRTSTSGASYGVYIGCGYSTVSGITVYQHFIGVYCNGNFDHSTVSNISCRACSNIGFQSDGDYSNFSNIRTSTSGQHGIYFNIASYATASGLSSYDDGSSTSYHGIYINQCDHGSFSSLNSDSAGGYGIYIYNSDQCTFASIRQRAAGSDGIRVYSGQLCRFSAVNANDNTSGIGMYFATSPSGHGVSGFTGHNNSGDDFKGDSVGTYDCQLVGYLVDGSGSFGPGWSEAGGDIL